MSVRMHLHHSSDDGVRLSYIFLSRYSCYYATEWEWESNLHKWECSARSPQAEQEDSFEGSR